jgi:hypothetical protein
VHNVANNKRFNIEPLLCFTYIKTLFHRRIIERFIEKLELTRNSFKETMALHVYTFRKDGVTNRPITKLYPLEVNSDKKCFISAKIK